MNRKRLHFTAAALLDLDEITLHRSLERHQRKDGVARFNGIVSRKVGRRWRVFLDSTWTNPLENEARTQL